MITHSHEDHETVQAPAPVDRTLRRRLLPGVVWGVVAFLVVLLAGGTFIASRQNQWSAEATTMVVPDSRFDPTATAGYYESLSRGQVLATIAQILQLQRFQIAAADKLQLTPAQRDRVTVKVQVVANTTVIQVTATAPNAQLAEGMANGVLTEASAFDGLPDPYVLSLLSNADRTARRSDPPRSAFAGVVVLVALVAAVATQQAAYHLGVALERRRAGGGTAPARPAATTPGQAGRGPDESS